jgi:uncharacterized protein YprB with RNaseH-like and TPR domain
MLRHSFCHIPGISVRRERALWSAGVLSWDHLLHAGAGVLPASQSARCREHISCSERHLDGRNAGYFHASLPGGEHWRLFAEFREETAYLDIETTGLSPERDDITTIALYDGREVRGFVKGINLDAFPEEVARFRQIVTFNGKCFDVPFIRRRLGVAMDHAHLDLRWLLKGLGYRGGLKACERRLGIARSGVEEVDGFMAVLLWKEYREGNAGALETLLAYNMADAVNLELLMVMAYNMKLEAIPFGNRMKLPLPAPPAIPHVPDQPTIRRIRASGLPAGPRSWS